MFKFIILAIFTGCCLYFVFCAAVNTNYVYTLLIANFNFLLVFPKTEQKIPHLQKLYVFKRKDSFKVVTKISKRFYKYKLCLIYFFNSFFLLVVSLKLC